MDPHGPLGEWRRCVWCWWARPSRWPWACGRNSRKVARKRWPSSTRPRPSKRPARGAAPVAAAAAPLSAADGRGNRQGVAAVPRAGRTGHLGLHATCRKPGTASRARASCGKRPCRCRATIRPWSGASTCFSPAPISAAAKSTASMPSMGSCSGSRSCPARRKARHPAQGERRHGLRRADHRHRRPLRLRHFRQRRPGRLGFFRQAGVVEKPGHARKTATGTPLRWPRIRIGCWSNSIRDRRGRQKSKLLAFDAATGKIVWQVVRPVPNSWATPIVIRQAGHEQVITAADPLGHRLQSGRWQRRFGGRSA